MGLDAFFLTATFAKEKAALRDGYPLRFATFPNVRINDEFWRPIIERNRTVTIPHVLRLCEETGMLRDFDRATNQGA